MLATVASVAASSLMLAMFLAALDQTSSSPWGASDEAERSRFG
jgi:hypothetical protein